MKPTQEVTLKDGSTAELIHYLGEYSIIVTEDAEEVISSDLIEYECLHKMFRKEIYDQLKEVE